MTRFTLLRSAACAATLYAIPANAQIEDRTVRLSQAVLDTGAQADTAGVDTEGTLTYLCEAATPAIVKTSVVSLETQGQKLLYVDSVGQLRADKTDGVDASAMFLRIEFADGSIALRDHRGNYLDALQGGGASVKTSAWLLETSRFFPIEVTDDRIALQAPDGEHYVNVNGDYIEATADGIGLWQGFTVAELSTLSMNAAPSYSLVYADLDGDADEDLILKVLRDDGEGYLIIDPLGIADTLHTFGEMPTDDFYDALSSTQQAALEEQLAGIDVSVSAIDSDDETGTGDYELWEQLFDGGHIPCWAPAGAEVYTTNPDWHPTSPNGSPIITAAELGET